MRIFEAPEMKIAMFNVKDVVTVSGEDTPTGSKTEAIANAKTYLTESKAVEANNIIEFTK